MVAYDEDVHGSFDETAPRVNALNNGNNYDHLQQHHRNQQQAAAFGKAALAEPLRAGVLQSPYNYPGGINPNYHNQNILNRNGQYYLHPQQQQQQQNPQQQYYRRGL